VKAATAITASLLSERHFYCQSNVIFRLRSDNVHRCSPVTILLLLLLSVQWKTSHESETEYTRNQAAVARIADRTAPQHLWGHVTSSVTWLLDSPYVISYRWCFGTKPLSLTVSEIFSVECNAMVDVTLIRPPSKGQSHSFWYQSISHIRLYIGYQ